jgi:hypothetical protein
LPAVAGTATNTFGERCSSTRLRFLHARSNGDSLLGLEGLGPIVRVMRGWGSSFALAAVGALLLWIGVAQFEGAYVPETGVVAGKVVRVAPAGGRAAIMFAEQGPRFVLSNSTLPHPTLQALADATSVSVVYDTRSYDRTTHAIVGLSVDGNAYFSPATYQAVAALLALIVLVPGTLMFGFGAATGYQRRRRFIGK